MPCQTCVDPKRCDNAGLCQDFGFAPFPKDAPAPAPVQQDDAGVLGLEASSKGGE